MLLSILEIKLDKIKDKSSQEEIAKEYKSLKEAKNLNIKSTEKIEDLFKKIKEVNLKLWNIEDKIRICEKNKDFGETFIDLARSVYVNNDKRAQIKSEINKILGNIVFAVSNTNSILGIASPSRKLLLYFHLNGHFFSFVCWPSGCR